MEGPSRHPQRRRPVPHRHHHSGPTFPQDLTGCATLASEPVRPPGANPRAPRGSQGSGLIKSFPSSSRPPPTSSLGFPFAPNIITENDQHHLFGCCSDFFPGGSLL